MQEFRRENSRIYFKAEQTRRSQLRAFQQIPNSAVNPFGERAAVEWKVKYSVIVNARQTRSNNSQSEPIVCLNSLTIEADPGLGESHLRKKRVYWVYILLL